MDNTDIILMIIKLLWAAFLIYVFVWIIVFSFYSNRYHTGFQEYTLFFLFCLCYVPLFIICIFTLPDNYEISIGWFIGLGFISVIFGFIYYFKYLKELFLALIDPRTKTYNINGGGDDDGSDVNFYVPQRHVNAIMEPIAPFLSDSDTKILFALSKYANKFMEIVK